MNQAWKPKHGLYLTTGPDKEGRGLLALISDGSPQWGDEEITVLDVEIFQSIEEAREWFAEMQILQPWNRRAIS
jgi:hypothetical protein